MTPLQKPYPLLCPSKRCRQSQGKSADFVTAYLPSEIIRRFRRVRRLDKKIGDPRHSVPFGDVRMVRQPLHPRSATIRWSFQLCAVILNTRHCIVESRGWIDILSLILEDGRLSHRLDEDLHQGWVERNPRLFSNISNGI